MNTEHRYTELQNANRQHAIARAKWAASTTTVERRKWDEQMQFWSNKAAFLDHAK